MQWTNPAGLRSHKYTCGFCGYLVASSSGYYTADRVNNEQGFIYLCPHCGKPSFVHGTRQIPGVAPGGKVEHLPPDIESLYNEARRAVSVSALTAAVLACRKLLMNIAVNHGAKEGATFISYVEHLASAGFVPPNGRAWVDHIRSKGNEATHEIRLMQSNEATELIAFAEMLLKFIYEFPSKIPAAKP